MTDDDGRFALERSNAHIVRVVRIGYKELRTELVSLDSPGGSVLIQLDADPIALESVNANANRNRWLAATGFYNRQRLGFGDFITRDLIESRYTTAQRIADILRTLPGVTVNVSDNAETVFGRGPLNLQNGTVNACAASVYLDGLFIGTSIPRMHPSNVEAIEVYNGPAQVPAQYGGAQAACGVVLIWLRLGTP